MIKESLERKGNGPMSEKKLEKNTLSHSLHEECGVFGMYDFDGLLRLERSESTF